MKTCTKSLVAAVMGISMSTLAFAQPAQNGMGTTGNAGGATPPTGAGATGAGSAGATPAAAGVDASGNVMGTQDRAMMARDMAGAKEADMKMGMQLDKIATMPDKAGDALFVLSNANGNMFEIEFAKLAQSKSQDSKVKELAGVIIKEHGEANEKLKPIAQKMGIEFPMALPSEKQKMLAIFSALSPTDFDTCYLLENKAVHAKDITSFADHQKAVKDEDLRGYIAMVLPKLKEHGKHIQSLATEKGFPTQLGGMSSADGMGAMDHGAMATPAAK